MLVLGSLIGAPARASSLDRSGPSPTHAGGAWFEDRTASAGIAFVHRNGDPDQEALIDQNGQGIAVLDYDRDGFADLLFLGGSTLDRWRRGEPGEAPVLYRNRGDGTFEDVTRAAGLHPERWDVGASVADFDGDGHPDLYRTGYGPNALYRNNGDGTFSREAGARGADDPGWGSSAAWGDTDGDGDLDLVVANYVHFDPEAIPTTEADGSPCLYRDILTGCPPWCWKGQGLEHFTCQDGRFRRTTGDAGLMADRHGRSFQALLQDLDGDGDLDLYVGCDVMPNQAYRNDGRGRFAVDPGWGGTINARGEHESGMGLTAGDLEGDGFPEIFLTNFAGQKNVLYANRQSGPDLERLIDVTEDLGLDAHRSELGWGATLSDLDLDGELDVFLVNGHIYPQVAALADPTDSYDQEPRLFRGQRDPRRFRELAPLDGPTPRWSARALAVLDLENDGDLDLVVGVHNGSPRVLVNRSATGGPAASWLLLELVGTTSNRDAIGTRVELRLRDGRSLMRWATPHQGFQGTQDARIHFGVPAGSGTPPVIESIRIRWPRGATTHLPDPSPGRILRPVEPAGP